MASGRRCAAGSGWRKSHERQRSARRRRHLEKLPWPACRDQGQPCGARGRHRQPDRPERRSEEQTSELQSLIRSSYGVFCLKKKINIAIDMTTLIKLTLIRHE